jgi:hypothetical protein
MPRFLVWQRVLFVACLWTAAFGLVLAVADTRLLFGFDSAFAQAMWQADRMPAEVVRYHRFVHGVLGATITAWALTLAFIAHGPFRRREPWAWRAAAASVAAWFTIDTVTSLAHGAWPNAALNVVAVIPLALPLLFTRSSFAARTATGSG